MVIGLIGTSAIYSTAKAPKTSDYEAVVEIPKPEPVPIKKDYSQADLKAYLSVKFAEYGIESQTERAIAVVFCESGWNWNPKPNYISWGIAQFTPDTWHDYGYGDIMNPYAQLETMARMWSNGLQSRWDCFTGKR